MVTVRNLVSGDADEHWFTSPSHTSVERLNWPVELMSSVKFVGALISFSPFWVRSTWSGRTDMWNNSSSFSGYIFTLSHTYSFDVYTLHIRRLETFSYLNGSRIITGCLFIEFLCEMQQLLTNSEQSCFKLHSCFLFSNALKFNQKRESAVRLLVSDKGQMTKSLNQKQNWNK